MLKPDAIENGHNLASSSRAIPVSQRSGYNASGNTDDLTVCTQAPS